MRKAFRDDDEDGTKVTDQMEVEKPVEDTDMNISEPKLNEQIKEDKGTVTDEIREDTSMIKALAELDRKNKLIRIMQEEFRQREAAMCQKIRELEHSKVILINHADDVKEELKNVKEELRMREEAQIKWEDYAKAFKIKYKTLKEQMGISENTIEESMDKSRDDGEEDLDRVEETEEEERCFENLLNGHHESNAEDEINYTSYFKCDDCQFETDTESAMKSHKSTNHEISNNIDCETCGQKFLNDMRWKII